MDTNDAIINDLLNTGKLGLFGAGFFGQDAYKSFASKYSILCFIDNSAKKQGSIIDGVPVYSLERAIDKGVETIITTLYARKSFVQIYEQLIQHGVSHLLQLIPSFFYNRQIDKTEDYHDCFAYFSLTDDGRNTTFLSYCLYHLTDHCNLNCVGCNHFSPLYRDNPSFADIEQFEKDMERLSKLFTNVLQLRLMGGEPLLNSNLTHYIDIARKVFPKNDLQIVTNGLLIPKLTKSQVKSIKKNDVIIDITVYPPTLQILDSIKSFSEESKIVCRYTGPMNMFSRPLREKPGKYFAENCTSPNCATVRNGKISKCPLIMHISKVNEYFNLDFPDNGILNLDDSLLTGSVINSFLENDTDLCRYCVRDLVPWQQCLPEKALDKRYWIS